jgi:RNA polymerase sigma-70 factor, ECF subfamily
MSPADERARRQEVDEFFDRYQRELLGFLLRMGLDRSDAEDILDDSFLVIWQYWAQIRDSNPRAYLYTVARNRISKVGRMRQRKPEDLMGDADADAVPAVIGVDFAQQVVDRETMRWALQELTERERETVLLRYYVGYDIAETAEVMGIRPGTVKRYAVNGLRKLYRTLTGGQSAARKVGTR